MGYVDCYVNCLDVVLDRLRFGAGWLGRLSMMLAEGKISDVI
jgi:hypothetical protein